MPLTYNLASKWAPFNERNRFVGFSLNGNIKHKNLLNILVNWNENNPGAPYKSWNQMFMQGVLSQLLGFYCITLGSWDHL